MFDRVLVAAGGFLPAAFLSETVRTYAPDAMICADAALCQFLDAGLLPTHLVGDFDTLDPSLLDRVADNHLTIERHNPHKDETDSELAMRIAVEMKPSEILFVGTGGGRLDHALANYDLLAVPLRAGICCRMLDPWNEMRLLTGDTRVPADPAWKYLSLLPFSEEVCGLTLEGTAYPLTNHHMQRGVMPGLCISNEITASEAVIHFTSGTVLMIRSRDDRNCRTGGAQ